MSGSTRIEWLLDRPWIYGVMVASANSVVAWRRRDAGDDPGLAILRDPNRPERIAAEGATLVAEGRLAPESGWVSRRWRFSAG